MRADRTTYPPLQNLSINSAVKFLPITTSMQNLMDRKHYFPSKPLMILILRLVSSSDKPLTYNMFIINMAIYIPSSHNYQHSRLYCQFPSCIRKKPRKPTDATFDSDLEEKLERNSKAVFASCFIFSFYFFDRDPKPSAREWFGLPKNLCPDPRPETFKSLSKNICLPKAPCSLWAVNMKGG